MVGESLLQATLICKHLIMVLSCDFCSVTFVPCKGFIERNGKGAPYERTRPGERAIVLYGAAQPVRESSKDWLDRPWD